MRERRKGCAELESQGWTGAICHCLGSQCLRKVSKHTINVSRPRHEYIYSRIINAYTYTTLYGKYLGTIVKLTKDELQDEWAKTKTKTLQAAGGKRGVPFTGVIKQGSSSSTRPGR